MRPRRLRKAMPKVSASRRSNAPRVATALSKIGPRIHGARVVGPRIHRPVQRSIFEIVDDVEQVQPRSNDLRPRRTLRHDKIMLAVEIDDAAEALERILCEWPSASTDNGHTACRIFPDCDHAGCMSLLHMMRIAAKQRLKLSAPISDEMRALCEAVLSKRLTRSAHRSLASSLHQRKHHG